MKLDEENIAIQRLKIIFLFIEWKIVTYLSLTLAKVLWKEGQE